MTTKEELERIDDAGMAAWSNHDPDAWADMFADDFVWHDWGTAEPIRDKAAARALFEGWLTAIPDMQVKTVARVIGEDAVAAEIEFSGTNTGPLQMGPAEIPATGRPVVGRGSYIAYVRDGKVVEYRSHADAAGLMMQLGLMPAP
jgi:predicted ester cyclase